PFISEHLVKQKFISCGRHAIIFIKGSHNGGSTCINGSFEGRQINLTHLSFRYIHCVVITTCNGRTIGGKVFCGGQNRVLIRQIVSLIAFYISSAKSAV